MSAERYEYNPTRIAKKRGDQRVMLLRYSRDAARLGVPDALLPFRYRSRSGDWFINESCGFTVNNAPYIRRTWNRAAKCALIHSKSPRPLLRSSAQLIVSYDLSFAQISPTLRSLRKFYPDDNFVFRGFLGNFWHYRFLTPAGLNTPR